MKRSMLSLFFMILCLAVFAQTKSLKGTVLDGNKKPLSGVTVVVKGTTSGTITDIQGNFELLVNASTAKTLQFTFMGYKSVEKSIGNATVFVVEMQDDAFLLGEVAVVGYGVQKKKLVTGATSQVKGEDMQRLNTVSPMEALKANTSGIQIVKSSGQPGSGYRINIRGLGTTGDATPLFIVDGMPVGDIDFLNPSDIQSTDILKDAASAAIYGSRAANGVVLITTKKGSYKSKTNISYDGYYGFQNVYKMIPMLNAQEYAVIMNEAQVNDGLAPFDFASLVPNWSEIESGAWKGTNWMEETRAKDAPIQNHSLSINGGSETSNYALGFSYTSQEGILGKPVAPKYERYNARYNGEQILFRNNGLNLLKAGESLVYSYVENSGIAIGDKYYNSIRSILAISPFLPLYDENGKYHYSIDWDKREPNPIALMDYAQGKNINKSHNLLANAYLELEPIRNLKVKSSYGYSFNAGSSRSFSDIYDLSTNSFSTDSYVSHSFWIGTSHNLENTLNYKLQLNEHSLDFLLGNTMEKDNVGESMSGTNVNSIFSDLKHAYLINTPLIVTGKTSLSSEPYVENKLFSNFVRINYDYSEKYMLTAIMRADASSIFAPKHRWGYFPSVSAGWNLSNEPFMGGTSGWLDLLKIRTSWGQNGNQNIDPFQYLSTISFIGADYYGIDKSKALTGAYPDVLPNSDIKWETSEQLDFGVDARFLKGKLDFTFDLYKKTTKDWLVDAPMLASYGTGSPYINGGNVENKGVELDLKWRDNIGQVNYSIGGNLSKNKNNVTKIANTEKIIHGPTNVLGEGMSELFRAQEGFPIGYFWGYKTDGLFQNEEEVADYRNSQGELIQPDAKPGDVRFVNTNDDNTISDDDKVMIGDPNPDYTFGLNLGADYKGLYFEMAGNGVAGNQIARSYRTPDVQKNNYTTEIFGRWHGEGTSNRIPRVSQSTSINWQYVSDLYIENGDYFRISNITIGYDFKKIMKSFPIQQLKIYASIQNAYTFTKYKGMDPEIGYNGGTSFGTGIDLGFYPTPRTVLFGTSIKF